MRLNRSGRWAVVMLQATRGLAAGAGGVNTSCMHTAGGAEQVLLSSEVVGDVGHLDQHMTVSGSVAGGVMKGPRQSTAGREGLYGPPAARCVLQTVGLSTTIAGSIGQQVLPCVGTHAALLYSRC